MSSYIQHAYDSHLGSPSDDVYTLTTSLTTAHTQGEDLDELLHLLCKLTGRLQLEPLLALAEQLAACAARAGLEVAAGAGMPLPPPLAGRGAGEGGTSFSPRSASRG